MASLFKRSLCNTFGGCGAKRSIMPHLGGQRIGDDIAAEERRPETNAKLISEIIEDIVEHLQRDQNYRQGKYVMFVPKQAGDGTNYMQRVDADGAPLVAHQQAAASTAAFRPEDELQSARLLS